MKKTAIVLFAFSFAAMSPGCTAYQSTLHPCIEIDSSFSPLEMGIIFNSLQVWEESTPSVSFPEVRIVDPMQVKADWKSNPDTPTAFIFRSQTNECPVPNSSSLGMAIGCTYTKPYNDPNSFVCANPIGDGYDQSIAVFTETIAHELGHVLGLKHLPQLPPGGGELMFWAYGIHSAQRPTCTDLQALQEIHPEVIIPKDCIVWHNAE